MEHLWFLYSAFFWDNPAKNLQTKNISFFCQTTAWFLFNFIPILINIYIWFMPFGHQLSFS